MGWVVKTHHTLRPGWGAAAVGDPRPKVEASSLGATHPLPRQAWGLQSPYLCAHQLLSVSNEAQPSSRHPPTPGIKPHPIFPASGRWVGPAHGVGLCQWELLGFLGWGQGRAGMGRERRERVRWGHRAGPGATEMRVPPPASHMLSQRCVSTLLLRLSPGTGVSSGWTHGSHGTSALVGKLTRQVQPDPEK